MIENCFALFRFWTLDCRRALETEAGRGRRVRYSGRLEGYLDPWVIVAVGLSSIELYSFDFRIWFGSRLASTRHQRPALPDPASASRHTWACCCSPCFGIVRSLGDGPRGCSWKHPAHVCLSALSPWLPPVHPEVVDCVISDCFCYVGLSCLRAELLSR